MEREVGEVRGRDGRETLVFTAERSSIQVACGCGCGHHSAAGTLPGENTKGKGGSGGEQLPEE